MAMAASYLLKATQSWLGQHAAWSWQADAILRFFRLASIALEQQSQQHDQYILNDMLLSNE